MDRLKLCMILEFILQQPIEEWLVKEIVRRLPAPRILNPHLDKAMFLLCLSSDLSVGRLSDITLQYLELLEEIDRFLGAPEPHEALKAAYCSLAAELTVAPLRRAGSPAEAEAEFLEVAYRIWNRRVTDLERSDAKGLVGKGLREWRREVEDATSRDDAARGRLLLRDTRGEAKAALKEYLNVALEGMGPPLLKLLAGGVAREPTVGEDNRTYLRAGSRVATEPSHVSAELSVSAMVALADFVSLYSATGDRWIRPVRDEERPKVGMLAGQMHPLDKDTMLVSHFLCTAEDNHVNRALDTISMDLPKAVENPLPEVTVRAAEIPNRMAETPADPSDSKHNQARVDTHVPYHTVERDAQVITSVEDREGSEECVEVLRETLVNPNYSRHNQDQADMDMVGPSVRKDAQATPTEGTAVEDQGAGECAKMQHISLMEHNPTAHTCQLDEDSKENLSEKSADPSKKPHLPTSKMERVSPLKLYKDTQFVKRRRKKKWTPQEEDALREAVKKYLNALTEKQYDKSCCFLFPNVRL